MTPRRSRIRAVPRLLRRIVLERGLGLREALQALSVTRRWRREVHA